ncbi:DUF5666 domain-containing protein [Thermoflexus sp.]|uniref:DUF5666 domain-containing protein n=1 Tax=Thermoflexus sp. TaxID=1969742 RepID=UPI0035E3FF26
MRLRRITISLLIALASGILGCTSPGKGAPVPTQGEGQPLRLPQAPSPSPAVRNTPSESIEEVLTLEGPIEAVIPGGYQVAGHRIQVSSESLSEGPLPPGIYVTVIGSRAPDGSILAESIEVLRRPEAEGEWEGMIQEVFSDGYRVDGRRVFVLPTTAVIGVPEVGLEVYISGFEQPDGSIVADSLIVIESP